MAIKLEPSQMKELATFITEKASEIVELVNTMDAKIDTETVDWEGNARDAYLETYKEILPSLNKDFPEVIKALSHNLRVSAEKIEERDNEIADALRKKA